MRRLLIVCLALTLAPAASASAADYVGAPLTHGPDSRVINAGPTMPAPAGGPAGHPGLANEVVHAPAVRSMLPSQWCGTETGADNLVNAFQNGTYRYHPIYMLPSDGRDRFQSLATRMQTDSFEASALLEKLYNRAIRFDLGTTCGSQYLNFSVVRMPQTTAQLQQLAGSASGTFDAIENALNQAGFPTIQPYQTIDQANALQFNYVVWLDGPAPSGSCGQATIYDDPSRAADNLNNLGGKVAAVYSDGYGGFCDSNTVRHEIGHNLGALQPEAPHAFDGMHCNDAYEDTMCYPDVSPRVAGGQEGIFFDYHNDDYWDPPAGPPLPWWTVNLNRFLCPDASCNVVPGAVDQSSPTAHGARHAHTRLRLRVRSHRRNVWRLSLRAGGRGRAVLAIRCRRHRGGQVQTVLTRTTRLPHTVRAKVHCVTRPTALAFPL